MKTRESGMPDEKMWETFFDPDFILDHLGVSNVVGNIVDVACGYGTFTIPAARRTQGTVYAIDIDAGMIKVTREKVEQSGLKNIIVVQRDFVTEGTGLADSSCEHVLLFNLLHAKESPEIITEAKRILIPGGHVSVIHWIYDSKTPRGPSLEIRPKPEQIQAILKQSGFKLQGSVILLPPWHYGLVGIKR